MAKNTGKGYRIGAVKNRKEIRLPNGNMMKINTETGRFMNQSKHEHKGVRGPKP